MSHFLASWSAAAVLLANAEKNYNVNLKVQRFSMFLPFHPSQADELAASAETFRRFLDVNDLDIFVMSSPCGPPGETAPTIAAEACGGDCHSLYSFIPDSKFTHICDEEAIGCEGCIDARMRGWYIQQFCKLGVARLIPSSYLLILDSDTMAVAEISSRTLIDQNGASRMMSGWCADAGANFMRSGMYRSQYDFALELLNSSSVDEFNYPQDFCLIGVTPEVLSTTLLLDLTDRIRERTGLSFYDALRGKHFTEFTLYNTMLLLEWPNLRNKIHNTSVSGLSRAFWASTFRNHVGESHDQLVAFGQEHLAAMHAAGELTHTILFTCQDETGLDANDCLLFAEGMANVVGLQYNAARDYNSAFGSKGAHVKIAARERFERARLRKAISSDSP